MCDNIDKYKQTGNADNEYLVCIVKATEFLQNNYADKITLKQLYTEAAMSRSAFLRHFKKFFGGTPFEYLNAYRISQAKVLLKETNVSITRIAQDCGFFDNSHFTKLFRKSESISPIEYRKNNQKKTY